jgi:hypothetical protein
MTESSKDVEQAIEVVAGNPTASELAADLKWKSDFKGRI